MEVQKMRMKITRDEMRRIRKLDHRQLEDYLTEVYLQGREDGFNRKGEIERLELVLEKVKGVGVKKKELIVELYDLECRQETGEIRCMK